ncbi:zinc ribbon domain-containing protein, partial [Klebsiella pneumoniae]|nr:zinc ribbon domain-containing protein [Klebsiella pneumoniae]
LETGIGGEGRFRHQTANASELAGTLLQWTTALRRAVPAGAGPQRNFCGQCGGKISPDKKFCGHCGAAL